MEIHSLNIKCSVCERFAFVMGRDFDTWGEIEYTPGNEMAKVQMDFYCPHCKCIRFNH